MSEPGPSRQSERKQSLLNKCLNERRRRDQENHYFEELAEIISASIADMSNSFSVKPEKCAILQETVKQIKQIKQGGSGGDSAVQQSQVSSSKPAILADDVLGPLLLEALDGFLFVVNSQGKVEFISNNVTQYLKYSQDDLVGKSVYNIIHVGDHAQFSNSLLPMSVSSGLNWPADNFIGKGRTFNCRLLIKSPCDDNDDVEIKQTYISQYENMQISSILQPYPSENFNPESAEKKESQSCLVCIARRLPLAEKTNTMLGVEQFTTRQDLNGKIIECDNSGISPGYIVSPDFVGKSIQDLCHVNDVQQLTKHLQEAITAGHNTSAVYRLRLQENKYVFVQTKSHLFRNPATRNPEFIISTHSIIRECDSDNELKGSASTSLMKSIIGPSSTQHKINSSQNSGLTNSGTTSMAVVGNPAAPVVPTMSAGNLFGLNDDIGEDFLDSMGNWDTPTSDNVLGGSGNVSSFNASSAHNSTSMSQSWNNSSKEIMQIKLSPHMQQQIHRSMSSGGQGQGQASSLQGKQRGLTLQNINQRSSSLDMGQKSPGFSQNLATRNQGFQLPGRVGFGSQRSPAASPSPHSQGRFGMPFAARTPSPMQSPSPGMGGSNWGHHQQSGLHSLQSFDSQNISSQDRLLQQLNSGLDSLGSDKKLKAGKLCQLLTQSSPPPVSGRVSDLGTQKKQRSRHNSRQAAIEMSPADSMHQSPQPGPGQSPPEKPQSTSNDDGDHSVEPDTKPSVSENVLLKTLLSQDDDVEETAPASSRKKRNSSSSQGAEAMALETNEPSLMEMDKNEAEAKKPSNILLKKLLSTEEDGSGGNETPKRKLSETNDSLIHRLLEDEQKSRECTSAPAESTSQDSDLIACRRHQSGPQEPQSTTTHSIPMPSLSSPLPSPLTTSFSQSQSSVDSSLLKGLFQSPPSSNMPVSSASNVVENQAQRDNLQTANSKRFDQLLHLLWDNGENSSDTDREAMKVRFSRSLKRKQSESSLDLDHSNVPGSASGTNLGPTATKLAKDNALLTQLLSKRASDDIVVNTQLTLQPSSVPQAKFITANLAEKLLKVKPGVHKTVSGNVSSSENKVPISRQLEAALSGNKGNPSSSQSLESMLGFNQNSNSSLGLGDSASNMSNNSQFKEQYEELQQLLSQTENSESTAVATEVDMSENTDPLLAQILQQAQDLQQDLTTSATNMMSSNNAGVSNSGNHVQNQPNATQNTNNTSNVDILSQLEQVLGGNVFNLTDIDTILNSSQEPSDVNEQLAIDAIQQQLMSEMLTMSSSGPTGNQAQAQPAQAGLTGLNRQRLAQNLQQVSPPAGSQIQSNLIGSQQDQLQQLRNQFQRPSIQQQQQQQQTLHHGYNQAPPNQSFPSPQASRLPQGTLSSALQLNQSQQQQQQQQRPMFSNTRPSAVSLQVRQSLIQQQKVKQIREQKQQEQQRLMLQRRQQFANQQQQNFAGQRFNPDGMALGNGVVPPPPFPENLAELMNSGTAPNVTLQRNQIPAPMSPRYNQGLQQQPSPTIGGQMMGTNNPQVSPNYPQQQQQQQQWNMRQQQALQGQGTIGMQPQGANQFNRHRSLSGSTLQGGNQAGNPRFPFSDSQFAGNQGPQMGGMFGQQQQQQQQMFQQNRSLQRQISMTGRGSPRTSQSPFGTSPQQDPLLMSPPEVSPNSSLRGGQGPQVSPSYNQGVNSNYGQSVQMSLSPQSQSLTSPQYSQSGLNSQGIDLDMNLFSNTKKPFDVPLSVNTPNSSQYIKQELRNICNARLEKPVFQSQMATSQLMQQLQPQQQQLQQQTHQQQLDTEHESGSELPPDILDQINEMTQEHGIMRMEDIKEEKVVEQKREEAKKRLENFRNITTTEDPDKKATSLFRTQLLTPNPGGSKAGLGGMNYPDEHRVNIVQKEPRTPVEEIKPANHKDSLLQQLLSD